MRDQLAEKLLAKVMAWSPEQIAANRPNLQAMAAYKYDEYQQFSPGMRFVESLALWLNQMKPEHRSAAFDFARRRLLFYSSAEMNHLIAMAYPDHIRPWLLQRVATELGWPEWHLPRAAATKAFRVRQRQCLFLGLSDGARVDVLRRYNPELRHEQVWQTYEIPGERANELLEALRKDLAAIEPDSCNDARFRTLVLIDDFSASGRSYLRLESDQMKGKIGTFYRTLKREGGVSQLVDLKNTEVVVLLYVATQQASVHLEKHLSNLGNEMGVPNTLFIVNPIDPSVGLHADEQNPIREQIQEYYDHAVHDEHMQKGGTTDSRYGFAACGLPVVLVHNTPNNSIALLWSYEDKSVRGLFPRVQRHRATT